MNEPCSCIGSSSVVVGATGGSRESGGCCWVEGDGAEQCWMAGGRAGWLEWPERTGLGVMLSLTSSHGV